MTIDEAKVFADNMTYEEAIMNTFRSKGIKYRKATHIKLNKMLEELKWYHSQDLILREYAKDASKMYFCKWYYNKCGSYSYCDQCAVLKINDIPKAEPPKE